MIVKAMKLSRCICFTFRRQNSTLVTSEIKNGIGVITLNDPKRLNALTEQMGTQFVDTVNEMNKVRIYNKSEFLPNVCQVCNESGDTGMHCYWEW